MKKEYTGISARIPEEVFEKMASLRDTLELTTNQLCTHAIEDWVEIAMAKKPELTKRLKIARYALLEADKQKEDLE